jgi:uncharacterized protein YybS (DUF2232 family)
VTLLNNGWKSLAWSAAVLVLLLSVPTPLNAITIFLLMTPLVILFVRLRPLVFAAHAFGIALAAFLLLGGIFGPLAITLLVFFLVPSVVMGIMYKKRKKARSVILAAFVVILAQLLLELVLFSLQFRIDLSSELSAVLQNALMEYEKQGTLPAGQAADMAVLISDAISTLLPMLLIVTSFLFAIITHGLTRWLLRRSGIEIPGLPEAKTWRLPRNLVFYYLIAWVLSFVFPPGGHGYWAVVSSNLIPILQYCFIIQAIGFFFFLADHKKWPRAIPVIIAVILIVFPPGWFPFFLIGLLDVAFPLRRYFVK